MSRPFAHLIFIVSAYALTLVSSSAKTATLELQTLAGSKPLSNVVITLSNDTGGVILPPKPASPLLFELPPIPDGSWEESLNVVVDGAKLPFRITRYHEQIGSIRAPIYIDPTPPPTVNNPQVERIEFSPPGSTYEDDANRYFRSVYAITNMTYIDGPFQSRVELLYFDLSSRLTADYSYLPIAEEATESVISYMSKFGGSVSRFKRITDIDPANGISKLDYARLEYWTDLRLIKSAKLSSIRDRCILAQFYIDKYDTKTPNGDKVLIDTLLGYDKASWDQLRQFGQGTDCKSGALQ